MKNMLTSPPIRGNRKNLIFVLLIAASFILMALPFIIVDVENAENEDAVLAAGPAGK